MNIYMQILQLITGSSKPSSWDPTVVQNLVLIIKLPSNIQLCHGMYPFVGAEGHINMRLSSLQSCHSRCLHVHIPMRLRSHVRLLSHRSGFKCPLSQSYSTRLLSRHCLCFECECSHGIGPGTRRRGGNGLCHWYRFEFLPRVFEHARVEIFADVVRAARVAVRVVPRTATTWLRRQKEQQNRHHVREIRYSIILEVIKTFSDLNFKEMKCQSGFVWGNLNEFAWNVLAVSRKYFYTEKRDIWGIWREILLPPHQ